MLAAPIPTGQFSPRQWRRRSADVGGLHLATGNRGQGQGWVDCAGELHTRFAELLSDMYTQTLNAVNEHSSDFIPTDLPTETRSRLINSLDSWYFEPHKLPDEEVLACTLLLFECLYRIEGMEETIGISLKQLSPFVRHLRQIYRWENSYHNFEHALDVLQATQSYLRSAGMVPPLSILLEPDRMWKSDKVFDNGEIMSCLGLHELFILYIAAIGHDVGHPGFSNVFMRNAQTPLSVVFDGKSALEQMHCHLLLRVMRHHGLGTLLDRPLDGVHVRKLLWETVLATDMSVHNDFMERFYKVAVLKERGSVCGRQVAICQAIMKCADISNPSRPYTVSRHWASALMEEWTSQASLEKYLDLPPSVQPSDDPLIEARSQVFFINGFAKPLLDLVVAGVPEMRFFAQHCNTNLELWRTRVADLEGPQSGREPPPLLPPAPPRQPDDYMSVFPLTLPLSHRPSPADESTLPWQTPLSRSSGSSSASSESNPCSPCDSVTSFIFSPTSETSNNHPASSSGSSNGYGHSNLYTSAAPVVADPHAIIRAAGKLGMRRNKALNRNSWSPMTYTPVNSKKTPSPLAMTNFAPSPVILAKSIKMEKSTSTRS